MEFNHSIISYEFRDLYSIILIGKFNFINIFFKKNKLFSFFWNINIFNVFY